MSFALRVIANCRIGGCPALDTRNICPTCSHWTPSRNSKYHACNRWWSQRIICELPRSACATCEFHIPPGLPSGRPNQTGIDWSSPSETAEYYAQKQREHRARKRKLEGK